MRDVALEEMVEITTRLFAKYVEPLAETMMTGEVPTTRFKVNECGTKDSDWLAKSRLRNSIAVSVYHCDVYLEDVMRLCRNCKMYLITSDVFRIAVLYYMVHPLYQHEWIAGRDVGDYESMMLAAGKKTCRYIRGYYPLNSEETLTLNILKYYMMVFTNRSYGEVDDPKARFDKYVQAYTNEMLSTRKKQFITARKYKAQSHLVNRDGFIVLERTIRRES